MGEVSTTCLKLLRKALDSYYDLMQSMFRMNELAFEELKEFNSTFKGLKGAVRRRAKEIERRFKENEPRFREIASRGESLREKMIEYLSALRDAIVACVPKREKKPASSWEEPSHFPFKIPSMEESLWIQAKSIDELLEELTGKETGWHASIISFMRDSEEVFEKAEREHLDTYDYIMIDVPFFSLSLDRWRVTPVVNHVYYADKLIDRVYFTFTPFDLLTYVYKKLMEGEKA